MVVLTTTFGKLFTVFKVPLEKPLVEAIRQLPGNFFKLMLQIMVPPRRCLQLIHTYPKTPSRIHTKVLRRRPPS
jgi:hypothetical protein